MFLPKWECYWLTQPPDATALCMECVTNMNSVISLTMNKLKKTQKNVRFSINKYFSSLNGFKLNHCCHVY
jgi:hypothetical protein